MGNGGALGIDLGGTGGAGGGPGMMALRWPSLSLGPAPGADGAPGALFAYWIILGFFPAAFRALSTISSCFGILARVSVIGKAFAPST